MAMAAQRSLRERSLDVEEAQILVYFAGDPVPYHQRTMVARLGGARWLWCSPDYEIEQVEDDPFPDT